MHTEVAAAFHNDCDSTVDAYPAHFLEDSPSTPHEPPCYCFQPPDGDDGFRFCLDTESYSLAQQMIMNDPESKALGTQWSKGNFGPDFAPRLEDLYAKAAATINAGQFSEEVVRAIRNIYCGWMSDYYEFTQQWSEAIEWRKTGLSMTSNRDYVACSMRLEEMMRDHGSSEEAEELRRARTNIGWSMSGVMAIFV